MYKVANSATRPASVGPQPALQPHAYRAQPQSPRRPSRPAALPQAGLLHRLWRVCHPQQARRNAMTLMQALDKPAEQFAGVALPELKNVQQAGRSVAQISTVAQALAEFRWTAGRANDSELKALLADLKPMALSQLVEDLLERDDPLSRRVSALLDTLSDLPSLSVARNSVLERHLNALLKELPQTAGLAPAMLAAGELVERMALPPQAIFNVCAKVVGQLPDASRQALVRALNSPALAQAQVSLTKAGRSAAEHFFVTLASAAEQDQPVSPQCTKHFTAQIAASCKKVNQQTTQLVLGGSAGVAVGFQFAQAARQRFDFRLGQSSALVDYQHWPEHPLEQNQRIAQGVERLSAYFEQQGGAQTASTLMAHTDDVLKALLASLDDQGQSLVRIQDGAMHWASGVTPSLAFHLDQGRAVMELTVRQELADSTTRLLSATVGMGNLTDTALQVIAPPAVRMLAP